MTVLTTSCTDEQQVAATAASWIAGQARAAVAARGKFLLAVSGGKTPWIMLRLLAKEDVPWSAVHLFQVDERVAPDGDADRNLTHLHDCLLENTPLPASQIHAMPVTDQDLESAASRYAATLEQLAGSPPVLDVVHLGLGTDGHTASLVPGDTSLNVQDRDVAITGLYQGRLRMTLTYPVLNRARQILWIATGSSKQEMITRLLAADESIPAGRVNQAHALLMTDQPL